MNVRPFLLCAIAVVSGWMLPSVTSAQTRSPDATEVVFTPRTTEAELLLIKDRMKAQNVELTYTDLQFKEGRLHYLAFRLVTDAGEGSAKADIKEDERFGFYYDPTPEGKTGFIVGALPTW